MSHLAKAILDKKKETMPQLKKMAREELNERFDKNPFARKYKATLETRRARKDGLHKRMGKNLEDSRKRKTIDRL